MPRELKRVYYTWDRWECYKAGYFEDLPPNGLTKTQATEEFGNFFKDLNQFEQGLEHVLSEWKNSCEHNLTNDKLNRIAWLGAASVCIMTGISSSFRSGYSILSEDEQRAADNLALVYLNKWLVMNDYEMTDGKRNHKSADIY